MEVGFAGSTQSDRFCVAVFCDEALDAFTAREGHNDITRTEFDDAPFVNRLGHGDILSYNNRTTIAIPAPENGRVRNYH